MKKNTPVTTIMSETLQTVHDHEPVSKLRQMFEQGEIHHLPVISGEKLVGIVSWNDFMRVSFGEFGNQDAKSLDQMLDHTYTLQDIMVKDCVTISKSATIRDAARVLSTSHFHALPVVDGEDLVGIVTSSDLIRYLSEQ